MSLTTAMGWCSSSIPVCKPETEADYVALFAAIQTGGVFEVYGYKRHRA